MAHLLIVFADAATVGIPELPGLWSLTPWGALIGLLVYLGMSISRGWWVPKSSHEREMATANKRGDEWKETALAGRELIAQQSAQISKFAEASKTPAEFFGTVMRDGGGPRVAQEDTTNP